MSRLLAIIITGYTCTLVSGCGVTQTASKFAFSDGYYKSRLDSTKPAKYYVVSDGDSIKVYPPDIAARLADTIRSITVLFPPNKKPPGFANQTFESHGFDLDVITILFKYRPPVKSFPNQINTNFNGALYAGYRTDFYTLAYDETPLHVSKRKINHFGYSLGGFAGAGTARIDEYVTLNRIDYEYDGAVVTTGVAIELNLNRINFVIVGGLDFLTDKNSHVWVNEGKGWVGVGLGLNLN